MKWCSGPCGRELPLTEFYRNLRGNPQGKCKGCHRIAARDSYRRCVRRRMWGNDRREDAEGGPQGLT